MVPLNKPFFSSSPWLCFSLILFSSLGQLLLIQNQFFWTLPVGIACYALAGLILILPRSISPSREILSASKTYGLLSLILIGAFLLRIYRLDQFPAGLFPDQGYLALNAEKIARGNGWPFYQTFDWPVAQPDMYYFLAAWFHFFKPSQISFFLYSVVFSLIALPLFYYCYRSLSNTPTALAALFFLYSSRWFLIYSRDGHPAMEVPFFIGLTLTFWLYAVQSEKPWAFALCGVCLASGFYSYQDLKVLPILIFAYVLYEGWRCADRARFFQNNVRLLVFFLIFASPALVHILGDHGLSSREKELLAFPSLFAEHGLSGVWNHFLETILVFNRWGDPWFYHNIPNHRQLDDVTGVLWFLGAFYALFHFKERKYFYALTGFSVFLLPAFLSIDSRHASRLMGTLPFVFFLSAQALWVFHEKLKDLKPKFLSAAFLSFLLFFSAVQNARDYFQVQANNPDCWRVCGGAEDSWVAQAIQRYSGSYNCFVCPKFYGNFQIWFLDYDFVPQIGYWKLPRSLVLKGLSPQKGVCLFFEEGQWGDLKLFQNLYPGGTTEWFKDLDGNRIAGLYLIPASTWVSEAARLSRHSWDHGLKGVYYSSTLEKGTPAAIQIDPLLNFTFRNDFPLTNFPPLSVHWKGSLIAPKDGIYEWTVLTSDDFQMSLDGKPLLSASQLGGQRFLRKGTHRLEARFKKIKGVDTLLSLLWKIPGNSQFEVLPSQVLKPFP